MRRFRFLLSRRWVLFLLTVLALAWVAAEQPGLPGHFANDEGTIISVNRGTFTEADSSFQLIAAVYRWMGLAEMPTLPALVGVASYLLVLTVAISRTRTTTAEWVRCSGRSGRRAQLSEPGS